ncbi:tyrosine-type recombinase/integrase [Phyllobacterium chamaecytisi]|uniref:tyrosine-type recombinase/integrase n=1 Tax=Phyllobacterium chamaecytisi TaxID=2876082 RepID=UPI001CCD0847|nr:DUF6538 domain-containing protein [Phyllobacterium sp. KW56]MBZ9602616.1 hypothetical protein [Phyllobacterium sp. KW56]
MVVKVNRHLTLKGLTYWFKMGIPEVYRSHFGGRTAYVVSTETGDLRKARDRRDQTERELLSTFRRIKEGAIVSNAQSYVVQAAEGYRAAYMAETDKVQKALIVEAAGDHRESLKRVYQQDINEHIALAKQGIDGDDIDTPSSPLQEAFDKVWAGRDPVDHYVEAWLKSAKLAEKTSKGYRGMVASLGRWAASKRLTLVDINRRIAGQFVEAELQPMHRKTAKTKLTAISGYWEYLQRRGLVGREQGNPWDNQLPKEMGKAAKKELRERAFTDDELATVLYGHSGVSHENDVKELALISTLSGMRWGELMGLTVKACQDGLFDLTKSKTQAGVRIIPIHSMIKPIIAQRMEGKKPDELLFQFPRLKNPTDALGKAFARHRVQLKVDQRVDGVRRSLVNAHSFRRTFITKARHANFDQATIADIVGHDIGQKKKQDNFTFDIYTSGASIEQKRKCVEAVTVAKAAYER